MASNAPSCWVKRQLFRLESRDRLIMSAVSLKGGEDLSDNEDQAFPDDAPAELVGAAGD